MGCLTPERVNQAFLAAPPFLSQQILDLSVKHPSFLRDIPAFEEWPVGVGNIMQQLVIRASMPQIERGFQRWSRLGDNTGCNPCEGPNCGYNWTQFPGHGIDRKTTELMKRDFRTPDYCIEEIQSTAHFREIFAKIVEIMFTQRDQFISLNIVMNAFAALSNKYVVDSNGPQANPGNPKVYRNVLGVTLSNFNLELAETFYEQMVRTTGVIPFDMVDGGPLYAAIASRRLFRRLYRDNADNRQDVRFSGFANDLLTKYNFMSTIGGMFLAAPIMWPRRFKIVSGEPVEILPFLNDFQAEVGSYTDVNPEYMNGATHEEVIMHGKYPFKFFTQQMENSLPGNASFGPEYSMMQNWIWVNPMTQSDPGRRQGYFWTSMRMGLSAQFSEGMFAVLVTIPSNRLASQFDPVPVLPPVIPLPGSNVVPAAQARCPIVLDIQADVFTANTYNFTFSIPVTGAPSDPINFALDNGAQVSGVIAAISADGYTVKATFASGLAGGTCANIVSVFCTNVSVCSTGVASTSDCRSGQTGVVEVITNAPLNFSGSQVVNVYMADCTRQNMTATLIDAATLTYSLQYAAGYGPTDNPTGAGGPPATNSPLTAGLICDRGGIQRICVPTAVTAGCPACPATY